LSHKRSRVSERPVAAQQLSTLRAFARIDTREHEAFHRDASAPSVPRRILHESLCSVWAAADVLCASNRSRVRPMIGAGRYPSTTQRLLDDSRWGIYEDVQDARSNWRYHRAA
jgi:hypothetical protein